MNEELNPRFQELSAELSAEFDLERGLDRLRTTGLGPRAETESGHSGTGQQEPASSIASSAATRPPAKRHSLVEAIDDAIVNSSVAVLEGMLIADNVIQVDLAKLEGTPTQSAIVVVVEGEHLQRPGHKATPSQAEPTAVKSAAARGVAAAITSLASAAAAVVLAAVGIATHLSGALTGGLALVAYLATLASAHYLKRADQEPQRK